MCSGEIAGLMPPLTKARWPPESPRLAQPYDVLEKQRPCHVINSQTDRLNKNARHNIYPTEENMSWLVLGQI